MGLYREERRTLLRDSDCFKIKWVTNPWKDELSVLINFKTGIVQTIQLCHSVFSHLPRFQQSIRTLQKWTPDLTLAFLLRYLGNYPNVWQKDVGNSCQAWSGVKSTTFFLDWHLFWQASQALIIWSYRYLVWICIGRLCSIKHNYLQISLVWERFREFGFVTGEFGITRTADF